MSSHLVVPHLPRSLNEVKSHFRHRTDENKRWHMLIATYALQCRTKAVVGPVAVSVTFFWKDRNRRDPDNFVKSLLDGLTRSGLIEDDGPPVLVSLTLASKWDPVAPRVEVWLDPAGDYAWELPPTRTRVKRKGVRTDGAKRG